MRMLPKASAVWWRRSRRWGSLCGSVGSCTGRNCSCACERWAGRNCVVIRPVRRYDFRRMIKALLLIFDPVNSWERVVRAQRGLLFVLVLFLLPLVALSCAGEGYGLAAWGK